MYNCEESCYEILNQIEDECRFDTVYACVSGTAEIFTIKCFKSMNSDANVRFAKEIRLIIRLSHIININFKRIKCSNRK